MSTITEGTVRATRMAYRTQFDENRHGLVDTNSFVFSFC
jgi:hypothetical protein